MAMNKKTRTTLILVGVAVAAYIIYRMYTAKQAASQTTSGTGQLGTNLNSVLTGLSSGPSTELNYYSTSTTTTAPVNTSTPGGGNVAGSGGTSGSGGTGNSNPGGTGTGGVGVGRPWSSS